VEPAVCDRSEPESIAKFKRGLPERGISGFAAEPYTAKLEMMEKLSIYIN
jgi:hypothetical protein